MGAMRLVLYMPEIAGNVGAAIRAAACFGAGVEIIEPCGFPADARGLKRAALDYGALAAPALHPSWAGFVQSEARLSGRLVLLSTRAATSIWDFSFRYGDMALIGQESAGVPDAVSGECDAAVRIPMAPGARSLNAATTGAIALAEMRRQVGWMEKEPGA
ncbi:MAG: tRNA (cytidine(34)-2'-O)-methyltransferase [Parvularculaceae bacterium]|nr:tRNA (cytidine(34)-2'-O)-methyltransferase [Parvularculaceae bacterium]